MEIKSLSGKNKTVIGHLCAILCVLVWGTTFVSTKVLLKDFAPLEIMAFRIAIAVIILFLVYPKVLKWSGFKQEFFYALAGITGVTLYFLLENIALTYSYASNVSLIVATAPLFTALAARIVSKTIKLRWNFFLGFAVAMVGIFLISFNGSVQLKINPLGDMLALGAAISWAVYCVILQKYPGKGNVIQATRRIFIYGLIFMIPAGAIMGFNWDFTRFVDSKNLLNMIFLGVVASAVCFVVWNYGMKLIGPVKTSLYIYANPVTTIVFSVLLLKEPLTIPAAVGAVLTLSGLVISQKH
ncbi:MAG: DMT family transporter [Ruminococcaceae bacterium]|nr:DMT family transporter [Oscillospiraceae bacterium]